MTRMTRTHAGGAASTHSSLGRNVSYHRGGKCPLMRLDSQPVGVLAAAKTAASQWVSPASAGTLRNVNFRSPASEAH